MKLFGYELKRASAASLTGNRITQASLSDFGWFGTKLSPMQTRALLNGMRAGSFTDGYELFSEMQDTWHTLAKNLQQLREAVASVRYTVAPYTAEGAAPSETALAKAALCRSALQSFEPDPVADENGFEDYIYDLTDSLVLGINVQEILWARDRGAILPRATCWVHPNQYAIGNDGRLGLCATTDRPSLYASQPTNVAPFSPDKFIVAAYKTRSGARTVGGLLRPLAWYWCAVQYGRDWVLRNAELFGQPFRDIEYDQNIKPEDLAELKLMAANMGSCGWITRPTGSKINYHEASKTGDASPQAELLDRAERACDLMILWQTLTSSTGPTGGGSLALGEVHLGVLETRKQNIANWCANVSSYQLFPSICRINFGDDDECPVLKADFVRPESIKEKTERIKVAGGIVSLPKNWTYEQLGIPVPAEGEETISPMPAPLPFPERLAARRRLRASDADPSTVESVSRPDKATADADRFAVALRADLAPIRAKYGPLLEKLAAALALEDEALAKTEIETMRPDLEAMLADQATVKSVLANTNSADLLEGILGREFLNTLSQSKEKK